MKNHPRTICIIAGILLTGLCHQASAVFVYDNSVTDLKLRFDPGIAEVGDEIILAPGERNMIRFDFEYWGTSGGSDVAAAFAGLVQARVRFYLNDGVLFNGENVPGTVFYDSGLFAVPAPTPRSTFVFTSPPDGLPFIPADSFTWSVQFTTANAADRVGVDLYSPPAIGGNFDDYWEKDPNILNPQPWSLKADPAGIVKYDFAARVEVPETTGIGICFMSFLSLLAFGRLTRRQ